MQDILFAVVDGLKGFPEAINTVFPETTVQTCIVHLIRNSLDFANWKDRKSAAAALKLIWLALRNVVAKWTGSRHDWKSAMTQFALLYPARFNIGI